MSEWLWLIAQFVNAGALCFVMWQAESMHRAHMKLHHAHREMFERHLCLLREIAAREMEKRDA